MQITFDANTSPTMQLEALAEMFAYRFLPMGYLEAAAVVVTEPIRQGGTFGKRRRKRWYRLPDDVIVVATYDEAMAIIRRLQDEYADEVLPPAIPELVALPAKPTRTAADFPARKPAIRELRVLPPRTVEVDFEDGLRAYLEGAKRRKDEDEWLLLMH